MLRGDLLTFALGVQKPGCRKHRTIALMWISTLTRFLGDGQLCSAYSPSACFRFPFRHVNTPYERPHGQGQPSGNHQQKQAAGCVHRREDQQEVPRDKRETTERHKNAEKPGKIARSKDQVPTENPAHAVEHREHRATVCKQLERQQRESIELIGREGLQIASASQDERRRKIKDFGGGKLGGADEPEERGEKGKILVDGPQQYVKDQRQRNITSGFYEVAGEAPAEQRAKSMDVVRCGGSVTRHNELGWSVGLTEATGDKREQEKDSRNS